MSTWQIYLSTTETLMNETTNFKNGVISQETYNQKMLLNLSYLLHTLNKQPINQNEPNQNPTLDFFLPVSQISYSMETDLINKTDQPNTNCIEKEDFFRLSSTAKEENGNEIPFEETPILSKVNHSNSTKPESFNFLDADDELTFNYNPNANTKFDINYLLLDDISVTDKYSFNSDEMKFSFGRRETRETSRIFGSTNSPVTSINYRKTRYSSSIKQKKNNKKENEFYEEFKDVLSKKAINNYINDMSSSYIKYMFFHYTRIKDQSTKALFCEDKMFLNLLKEFILSIGVSDKKLYEDTLRNIVYQKESYDFEIFLSCFQKILKLKDEMAIIKFKFLLYITRLHGETEITRKHIFKFFDLIKCKKIFDEEICDEIIDNLIERYCITYPGKSLVKFNFQYIVFILESFFENK